MTKATDIIENEFRSWAFHAYYSAYANEDNLEFRFVRAIVESAKPVPPARMMAWKAARKDIRRLAGRFNRGEIDRAEWATQVASAIFAHTGKEIRNRAWQDGQAEKEESVEAISDE